MKNTSGVQRVHLEESSQPRLKLAHNFGTSANFWVRHCLCGGTSTYKALQMRHYKSWPLLKEVIWCNKDREHWVRREGWSEMSFLFFSLCYSPFLSYWSSSLMVLHYLVLACSPFISSPFLLSLNEELYTAQGRAWRDTSVSPGLGSCTVMLVLGSTQQICFISCLELAQGLPEGTAVWRYPLCHLSFCCLQLHQPFPPCLPSRWRTERIWINGGCFLKAATG